MLGGKVLRLGRPDCSKFGGKKAAVVFCAASFQPSVHFAAACSSDSASQLLFPQHPLGSGKIDSVKATYNI